MDIATTTLILVSVAFIGGYVALSRLFDKIDHLQDDVREFAKIDAAQTEAREASLGRSLGRIEGNTSASYEGITDLRNTLENR